MTKEKDFKLSWFTETIGEHLTSYTKTSLATRVLECFRSLNIESTRPRPSKTSAVYITGRTSILITLILVARAHMPYCAKGVQSLLQQVVDKADLSLFINPTNLLLQLAFDENNSCVGIALSRHFTDGILLEIPLDHYFSYTKAVF